MDKEKVIELLQVETKPLTDNQRKMLKEEFNYNGRFEWATDNWGYLIIACNDDTYKRIKYYLALEYEESEIDVLIKSDLKVLVSYANTERVTRIIELLEENE